MAVTGYAKTKAWREQKRAEGTLRDYRLEESRKYRIKHPEVQKAASARYNAKPESKAKAAQGARRRRAADPKGQKVRVARWRAKREAKLTEIAGRPRPSVCELCHSTEYPIVFDHCHAHGHFRGWICDQCNKVLGLVKDKPDLLRAMAQYLENNSGEDHDQSA